MTLSLLMYSASAPIPVSCGKSTGGLPNRRCASSTAARNPDAVDAVLTNTRKIQPEQYLDSCSRETKYDDPISKKAVRKAQVMTLPCSNETDARSLPVAELEEGDKISVLGSIRNSAGNKWYQVEYTGEEGYRRTGYLFSGHLTDLGWFEKLVDKILR